jgi:hypothetical protein
VKSKAVTSHRTPKSGCGRRPRCSTVSSASSICSRISSCRGLPPLTEAWICRLDDRKSQFLDERHLSEIAARHHRVHRRTLSLSGAVRSVIWAVDAIIPGIPRDHEVSCKQDRTILSGARHRRRSARRSAHPAHRGKPVPSPEIASRNGWFLGVFHLVHRFLGNTPRSTCPSRSKEIHLRVSVTSRPSRACHRFDCAPRCSPADLANRISETPQRA